MESLKKYLHLFVAAGHWLKRYTKVIALIVVAASYGFIVLRIQTLSYKEPTNQAVTDKLQTIKHPRIDQKVADQLKALEDQNVQINSLFKQARENPFQE